MTEPVTRPYNPRGYVVFWLTVGTVDLWLGAAGLGAGKSNWYIGFIALGIVLLTMAADLEMKWQQYETSRRNRA
jgi:hypothetical protein